MPVDVTEEYIRIPQKDPDSYQDGSLRPMILDVAKGIRAVIGALKGKGTTEVQSYLFRIDEDKEMRWNTASAQAWVTKYGGGHRSERWQSRAAKYEGDRDLKVQFRGSRNFQLSELSTEEQGEQVSLFEAAGNGIVLNRGGVAHAKSLITSGHSKDDAAWGFSAADGNKILGKSPKEATAADWNRYASWHLGINKGAKENSKDRYKFPIGKGGFLYRRALRAIAQRASQFGYSKISEAASSMIEQLRKQDDAQARDDGFTLLRFTDFVDASTFAFKQEDGEGKAPTEFKIVGFGVWSSTKYGNRIVDEASAQSVMAHYKMRGMEKLPIDWEHQTFNTQQNGQPAPAIGFFKPEIRGNGESEGDGIWAVAVEWTAQAIEWFKNKQYRHFSPTGQFDKMGKLATITTLALTNLPATNNQEPLIADDKGEGQGDGGTMDLIMETLGLKPEDSEEKAVEVIKDMVAKAEAHGNDIVAKDKEIADFKAAGTPEPDKALEEFKASVLDVCGLKADAKDSDVKVFVATLKAQEPDKAKMIELEGKVKDLEGKEETNRQDKLLSEFSAKETPANKETMTDLAKILPEPQFRATMELWPDVKADGPKPAGDKKIDGRNAPTEFKLTEIDELNIKDRLEMAGVERDTDKGKEIVAHFVAAKKQGDALMKEMEG